MRRHERASTLLTSNHPVEDWGKLLGDSAAVTAMLDRLLHHGHILKCDHGAGERKQACRIKKDRLKESSPGPRPLAGFDLTTEVLASTS
jgi:DNA replication protein DnaC